MKNLRYDLYAAALARENRHPEVVMRELGITYQDATPQPTGAQWLLWDCENLPAAMPKFLTEITSEQADHRHGRSGGGNG